MYERVGMGWSELDWLETIRAGLDCEFSGPEGKNREVCFLTTPEDEQIAHVSGCTRLEYVVGSSDESSQRTCQNDNGRVWCCPEGYPREYMQTVPSDVSSYEEERRQLLAQQPIAPDDQQPETPPDSSTPAPVSRHTFWTRLTHPGAITAMAAIAGGGALFYYLRRRRAGR